MIDKSIRVFRTPHTKDRPYFSMNRKSAQDSRISWEARGVLAYLLSKPDDWQLMVIDIQQNCGRDKAKRIIAELAEFGYLKIEPHRDDNGKFSHNEYKVIETPFTEKPSTVKPHTDNPSTENPPLHSIEDTEYENKQPAALKPRRINVIFDYVAKGSFGITDTTKLDNNGGRIGKITGWLKKHGATIENLEAFYLWYARDTKGASAPKDLDKFTEWYVRFEEIMAKTVVVSNILDLSQWETPQLESA